MYVYVLCIYCVYVCMDVTLYLCCHSHLIPLLSFAPYTSAVIPTLYLCCHSHLIPLLSFPPYTSAVIPTLYLCCHSHLIPLLSFPPYTSAVIPTLYLCCHSPAVIPTCTLCLTVSLHSTGVSTCTLHVIILSTSHFLLIKRQCSFLVPLHTYIHLHIVRAHTHTHTHTHVCILHTFSQSFTINSFFSAKCNNITGSVVDVGLML